MPHFARARARLDFELRDLDLNDDRVNFRRERQLLLQRVAAAGDELQRRAVAGAVAGLMKRWSGFVIETLTAEALGEARPGREHVRAWQRTLFGKSCASGGSHGMPRRRAAVAGVVSLCSFLRRSSRRRGGFSRTTSSASARSPDLVGCKQ